MTTHNEHERMVEEMGRKFNNDLAFQLKPSNDTIAAVRAARKLFEETITTLKHQGELEKAVEEERERIYAMIESLPAFTCCSDKCMGKVSDEAKKPMWGTNYLEREAVLQALTPTKTDKQTEV